MRRAIAAVQRAERRRPLAFARGGSASAMRALPAIHDVQPAMADAASRNAVSGPTAGRPMPGGRQVDGVGDAAALRELVAGTTSEHRHRPAM